MEITFIIPIDFARQQLENPSLKYYGAGTCVNFTFVVTDI